LYSVASLLADGFYEEPFSIVYRINELLKMIDNEHHHYPPSSPQSLIAKFWAILGLVDLWAVWLFSLCMGGTWSLVPSNALGWQIMVGCCESWLAVCRTWMAGAGTESVSLMNWDAMTNFSSGSI
jgi:hypothetical protein